MKRSVLLSNSGAGVCQFAQGLSSFLPLILFEKLPLWLALPADRQGLGQGALAGEEDPRVDVALYFVAPHRLRPVDIDFITRLSENVPVVRRMCAACAALAAKHALAAVGGCEQLWPPGAVACSLMRKAGTWCHS